LAETVRGINIVISGNTTALTASLTEVNRASKNISGELRHVQNLLRMSPGNTTLIRQQQELLGQAVENTRERLDRLRAAEQQVREQFSRGEISGGQMRAFERELQSAEINLNRFENRLEETQDTAENLSDTLGRVGEDVKGIGEGIQGVGEKLTVGITAPIAGFAALAVAGTQELRKELAILKTNAEGAGVSVNTANEAFRTLNGIRDDIAANSETVNELLASGFDGEELKKALEGVIGAGIKFKDTLNFEGIADGIQESFGVKEAAGSFLEVLERMGVSVDDFNAGLVKSIENGTQSQYVLDTLAKLGLNDVYNAYTKNNKAMIENAKANYDLQLAMSNLGAIIEPVVTVMVNRIGELVDEFNKLSEETQNTVLVIAGVAATLGPLSYVIGSIVATVGTILTSFPTLGSTIASVVAPIAIAVVAIAGIAFAIKELWKTNEDFRNTVKEIWEDIKVSAETIFNALKEFWKEWGDEIISIVTPVWETVKSVITSAITIIGNIIALALNVITGDWSGAWDNIKNIFSAAWDGIKAYASGLGETMKAIFGTIAAMAITWGSNIIQGIVNGITSKLTEAKNAALRVAGNIKDAITNFFDIKSPSEVTKRLGEYIAEGLAKGIEGKTSDAEKAAQKLAQVVQSAISKVLSDIDKTFQIQTAKLELEILAGGANITEIQRLEDELKKLQLQYDQSTEKLQALNDVYKTAKDKLGENSDAVKDYKQQLELAKIAHEKLSIEISNNRFAQEKAAIKENIEALQELTEAAKETYEETIKSATENYKKLEELNREIVDLAKEERDEKIQAANDYSDAQKEYYDEIYDKAKETYDNTVQRARDSYNSIIDAAILARDTELAALQGQLDAINDEEEQRDRDAERQELETAITRARTTRERTEAEAALAEWLRKQEIEEKKQSIAAQMEQVKADYEEKESLAEKQLEYAEDAAEKALSRAEERYERDTENLERETENKLRIIEEQYQEKLTLAEADLVNAKSMYDQEEAKAKATFAAITGYMIDRYDAEKEKQDELKQNMNEYYEELARLSAEYERQKAAGNMEAANAAHEQANKIRTDAGISSYYDSTTGAVLATPTVNTSASVSTSSGSSSGGQNYVTYNGKYGYWNNFGEFTEVSKYGTGAIVGRPTMGIFGDVPEAIMPLAKLPALMTEALLGAVQILSPSQSAMSMAGAGATSNSYNFSFTGPISVRDDSDITQLSRELYNLSQNAARVRGVR